MRTLLIDGAVDLTATANGDAVDLSANNFPFTPGATAVASLGSVALDDTALKLQGSEDGGDTWADLVDTDGNAVSIDAAGTFFFEVVLPEQIRTVVTIGVAGVGVGQVALLGN